MLLALTFQYYMLFSAIMFHSEVIRVFLKLNIYFFLQNMTKNILVIMTITIILSWGLNYLFGLFFLMLFNGIKANSSSSMKERFLIILNLT